MSYILGIQHQLNILIPEKWESIYLYASVIESFSNLKTWEMYFYYTPKGKIKRNAINVYEIPNKFNVEEEEYLKLVDNLCNTIKRLYKEYIKTYDKSWSNIVIAIKDSQFLIEYNDENLLKSKFSSKDRHIIFKYKYLNIPLQRFSKKEQKTIEEYLDTDQYNSSFDKHFKCINQETIHNYIEYERIDELELEDIYANQFIEKKKKGFSFWKYIMKLFSKNNQKIIGESVEPILEPKIQILNNKY